MDISTPAGVRRPDVGVIDAEVAAAVRQLGISLYQGADLRLVVEVVSRGSGSEREDRGRKVYEYAEAGIRKYWVVDFDPRPRIQVRLLEGDRYGEPTTLGERDTLQVGDPFPICFKLSTLTDFS